MLVRIDKDTGCICELVNSREPYVSKCEKVMPNNLIIYVEYWEALLRMVNELGDCHICDECWEGGR